MWYNKLMLGNPNASPVKNTLAAKYAMQHDDKAEIFHTSAYAQAQANEAIGAAAGTESFQVRQELENQRKFVRGYKDSKLMQGTFTARGERAKTWTPNRGEMTEEGQPKTWRERQEAAAANPMDIAMTRARGVASTPNGIGGSQVARKVSPMLGKAKAPSIPSRRAGI